MINIQIKFSGFHPQLSHPVEDTKAVKLATQRHFDLYNKIAERNSNPNYAAEVAQPKESAAVGELSSCTLIIDSSIICLSIKIQIV